MNIGIVWYIDKEWNQSFEVNFTSEKTLEGWERFNEDDIEIIAGFAFLEYPFPESNGKMVNVINSFAAEEEVGGVNAELELIMSKVCEKGRELSLLASRMRETPTITKNNVTIRER
jgi:hypothetical protein